MKQNLMMSTFDLDVLDAEQYGRKAYWLSWLQKQGYKIPYTIFLPTMDSIKELFKEPQEFSYFQELLEPTRMKGKYDIAIRSSATIEDAKCETLAGHFSTFIDFMTFDEVISGITKVLNSLNKPYLRFLGRMGVVVQKRINASFAGIALSSDPFVSAKHRCLISVIPGMGAPLMSGEKSGEDIAMDINEGIFSVPQYITKIPQMYLTEIGRIAKEIEKTLDHPVDLEWCVEQKTGALYLVQCRFATGNIYSEAQTIEISLKNEKVLPPDLSKNEKVLLRLAGERTKVPVSKAFLVTVNGGQNRLEMPDLSLIQPSPECKGYSVVLLRPDKLAGKVTRSFVGQDQQDMDFIKTCARYSVRSYPEHSTLTSSIESIARLCLSSYWTICMIVQEIFDPKYAGIIKRVSDGYTIELAYGHFVPKGVVPTSRYILDEQENFLDKNEIYQLKRFRILNGCIVEESIDLPDCRVSLDKENLVKIIKLFRPFLHSQHMAVEFGILEHQDKTLYPYLIDFIEDKSASELSSQNISEGVLSMGSVTGKVIILQHDGTAEENTFDMHFHDQLEDQPNETAPYIFCCQMPNMSLLKVIRKFTRGKLGFVFREGSVLCHLAIILREQGIPAIIVKDLPEVNQGEVWTVDASTPGLRGKERLQRNSESQPKNYILTYVNPDTDGVCSAIGYEYLALVTTRKEYLPIVFGTLNRETALVLSYFQEKDPIVRTAIPPDSSIVLVDTHHVDQLPPNIPFHNVLEIMDHHPGGNPEAFPNAIIQNENVGAVATLITERIQEAAFIPPPKICGLLAAAIISNTLNFSAPSTCERDHIAFRWLQKQVTIDDKFIHEMFKARSDVAHETTLHVLTSDLKVFTISHIKIAIAQLETVDLMNFIARHDMLEALSELKHKLGVHHCIFNGVDIIKRASVVATTSDETKTLLTKALGAKFTGYSAEFSRILLRKTDFIPALEKFLKKER